MFAIIFVFLCIVCAVLLWYVGWRPTSGKSDTMDESAFFQFQRTYLLVYLAATAADWLQGAHVYALYDNYKMSKHEIELLFIAGFGSSMVFGTFIGGFADKYGRRRNCILYGLLYGTACVTKHFANFWILLVGRLLAGVATSILYSAFESWLVFEHSKRGFGEDTLTIIFSFATFGNSVAAIGSGVVAQFAADLFGYVAPFDVALTVLIAMCIIIVFTWSENFGDSKAAFDESFRGAWRALCADRRLLYLGLIQSLFEGAMYTFVLEWTPSLTNAAASSTVTTGPTIPHGFIFATFMVAVMIGSSVFRIGCKLTGPESFMRAVLLVAALSLLPVVIIPTYLPAVYGGFITFEMCVGIFWPAMGYMRGIYVPEAARATLMNFFRVPLNLIVVVILSQDLPLKRIFQCCVLFLAMAWCLQCLLYRHVTTNTRTRVRGPSFSEQTVANSKGEQGAQEDDKFLVHVHSSPQISDMVGQEV